MFKHRYAIAMALICHASAAQETPRVEIKSARFDQRRMETAATLVLRREELEARGDRTLTDALQRMPGITISENTGRGTEIRMRGLGNGYTQILLNGVATPSGFALESLAPEMIERVEIVRNASAELGTQAIAGTINIILRKSVTRATQEFKIGTARQGGTWSPFFNAQTSGKSDSLSYALGTAYTVTSTPEDRHREETSSELHRLTSVHETNVGRSLSLTPRLTWTPRTGDVLNWQNFAAFNRRTTGATAHETLLAGDATDFPDLAAIYRARGTDLRSDLSWQRRLDDDGKLDLRLGVNHYPRRSSFDFAGTSSDQTTRRHVEAIVRESGMTYGGKFSLPVDGNNALVFGWDGAGSRRMQTRDEQSYHPDGELDFALNERYKGRIERIAVFAQDDWQSGEWSLSAGLRWEVLKTVISDRALLPVQQKSAFASPVLQVMRKLPNNNQLRLGVSRTYKAPKMFELIPRRFTVDNNNGTNNPDTQGNPWLRPEFAWGVDAAYDHYLGKDGLLSFSAYARRIDDVILQKLFEDGKRWVAMPSNEGKASMQGLALEAKLPLSATISLRANLARNWSRVASVPGPDNRLDRQTPVSANIGADYQLGALTLGADFHYEGGGNARLSERRFSADPYRRKLDLSTVWAIDGKQRLRIGAVNLLRQEQVSTSAFAGDDGILRTRLAVTGAAALRVTYEYSSK